MLVNCFDIAEEVIKDTSKKINPTPEIDEEKLDILSEYCDAIDRAVTQFFGQSLTVNVDESTGFVEIVLECGIIHIFGDHNIMTELFNRAIKFGFASSGDPDTLLLKLTFPSVWVNTKESI